MASDLLTILQGDALEKLRELPEESVQCCVCSPPFWGLRDYGVTGQLGLEKTPEEYVAKMVEVFREVRRVLKKDGTLWLNLGDSYAAAPTGSFNGGGFKDTSGRNGTRDLSGVEQSGALDKTRGTGLKPKDLCGIPWMVAFALRADGWWLRSDIIWNKANCMPESVLDRPTKSHEYIFLLTKSATYFYDAAAIAEPVSQAMLDQIERGYNGQATKDFLSSGAQDASATKSRILAKYKTPDGWDTSEGRGGHGSFHKDGREKGFLGYEYKPRLPNHYKGSLPGREDGPGQERRSYNDREGFTRNKRSVWTIATQAYPEAHFATYPPDLIKPCILAGTRVGDTVLDPFAGSFTTCMVALELGRKAIGIELNPDYIELGKQRCNVTPGLALA